MKDLLYTLSAPLAIIGERLSSAIEQAGELLTSRSGLVGEFIMNESGRVNPEQGFRFAWAAGVIVAAMVVLGTPPKAAAHPGHCSTIKDPGCVSHGQCRMWCQVWEGCSNGRCIDPKSEDSYCECDPP